MQRVTVVLLGSHVLPILWSFSSTVRALNSELECKVKKNRSQSSENKWAQCFFHLVLNLELIAECYRFPLRAATHSSSSHLWSSPSLMGTSSRTARECQMRWEHKQMQWHYHVVFMQWFQLGLLYTHVISWVAEAIWGLRSVKRTTFCVSTY